MTQEKAARILSDNFLDYSDYEIFDYLPGLLIEIATRQIREEKNRNDPGSKAILYGLCDMPEKKNGFFQRCTIDIYAVSYNHFKKVWLRPFYYQMDEIIQALRIQENYQGKDFL